MHRCGTSAFARALSVLGVDLGDHFLEPGPENPKGFFENPELLSVSERVLTRLQRKWHSLDPLSELSPDDAALEDLRDEATRLLRRLFGGSSLWGFKDP